MAENKAHWYTPDSPSFDPGQYPKIYREGRGGRIFKYVVGIPFLIIGLLGILVLIIVGMIGIHKMSGSDFSGAAFSLVLLLFLTIFGAYEILSARRTKTILLADAIEIYGPIGLKRLGKEQIAGWRLIRMYRRSDFLILEPISRNLKKIRVPDDVLKDSLFRSWVASLPDLNIVDAQRGEAEIAADESLGTTPEERLARLANARKVAKWLQWLAYGLFAVSLFHPRFYALPLFCVMAVMPWLVMLFQFSKPKLYSLGGRQNQARASLVTAFALPGAALAWWALKDAHLVNWHPLVGLTAAVAILMAGIPLIFDDSLRAVGAVAAAWMLLLGCLYGYGASVIGDVVTDASAPQTFHVAVMDKHVSHGRYTLWKLKLAPWGPVAEAGDVDVSSNFYDKIAQGDTICANLRRGSIGVEWYTLATCN